MRAEVQRDLDASHAAFVRVVWPAIAPLCGGGSLVHLEGSTHPTDRDLDLLAGIDGYQRQTAKGMRGIASRVQPIKDAPPWDTFTVRVERDSGAETEYEKRLRAVYHPEGGWLCAHLTVQAYVDADDGRLLSAAVVRTADLLIHADMCSRDPGWATSKSAGCYTKRTTNATFLVVPWAHLIERDVTVKIARAASQRTAA